jgi:hypothetical protein
MLTDLATRVAEKIRAGALPRPPEPPEKYFAGKGTGQLCDVCEQAITPEQLEYEWMICGDRRAGRQPAVGRGRRSRFRPRRWVTSAVIRWPALPTPASRGLWHTTAGLESPPSRPAVSE